MSVDARPASNPPSPSGPAGPRPSGPAHPRPSGPAGPGPAPSGPPPASPTHCLPRLGEVIRDAERYLAQALATLDRTVDPASLPVLDGPRNVALNRLSVAGLYVGMAEQALADLAATSLPAAGSAVKLPPRPAASEGCAVPGGAGRPPVASGKEPTPGSAAVFSGAACESDGSVVDPVAGAPTPPLETGRPSGLVELGAPCRADRSAGSAAHAPGADGDFRLPRDVRPPVCPVHFTQLRWGACAECLPDGDEA